jgi:hypothetical protein
LRGEIAFVAKLRDLVQLGLEPVHVLFLVLEQLIKRLRELLSFSSAAMRAASLERTTAPISSLRSALIMALTFLPMERASGTITHLSSI